MYGPSKFTYDAAHELYVCPQGQPLRGSRTEYQAEKAVIAEMLYPNNSETPRPPEQQPLPYYRAARFKTKQEAEQPYVAAQETIRTMECDLYAYRFLLQWEEPSDKPFQYLRGSCSHIFICF